MFAVVADLPACELLGSLGAMQQLRWGKGRGGGAVASFIALQNGNFYGPERLFSKHLLTVHQ